MGVISFWPPAIDDCDVVETQWFLSAPAVVIDFSHLTKLI